MKPLTKTSKTLGGFLGALLLSGCMTAGGGSTPSKPYASTSLAFQQFKKICLQAPFNTSRNIAAFRATPGFVENKGGPVLEGSKITSFEHSAALMSGSVSVLASMRSCTVSYTPAGDQDKEALIAAALMNATAGIGVRPKGITGGGFVSFKYKSGNLMVLVDHKRGGISLSTVKQ